MYSRGSILLKTSKSCKKKERARNYEKLKNNPTAAKWVQLDLCFDVINRILLFVSKNWNEWDDSDDLWTKNAWLKRVFCVTKFVLLTRPGEKFNPLFPTKEENDVNLMAWKKEKKGWGTLRIVQIWKSCNLSLRKQFKQWFKIAQNSPYLEC